MDVQKVKTVLFATLKKIQGYTLLRNHGVASPYEVNMVKTDKGIDTIWGDRVDLYVRIKRDFGDTQAKTHKVFIKSVKFLINGKYTDKKNLEYKEFYGQTQIGHNVKSSKIEKRVDPEFDIFAIAELNHRLHEKRQKQAYFLEEKHSRHINGPERPSFLSVLRENIR